MGAYIPAPSGVNSPGVAPDGLIEYALPVWAGGSMDSWSMDDNEGEEAQP